MATRKLTGTAAAIRRAVLEAATKMNAIEFDSSDLDMLDAGLNGAERELLPLLLTYEPAEVAGLFAQHVRTHLTVELAFIKTGVLDDPSDALQLLRNLFLVLESRYGTPDRAPAAQQIALGMAASIQ